VTRVSLGVFRSISMVLQTRAERNRGRQGTAAHKIALKEVAKAEAPKKGSPPVQAGPPQQPLLLLVGWPLAWPSELLNAFAKAVRGVWPPKEGPTSVTYGFPQRRLLDNVKGPPPRGW